MSKHVVERIRANEDSLFFQEHFARYQFAALRLTGGPTLDIATGTGYGADFLARSGYGPVIGADVDIQTLLTARTAYDNTAVEFVRADGMQLPFTAASFRSVVTLETLEHVENDTAFLHEIVRVLTPDGVCVLSTPDRDYSSRHSVDNPFHVREYVESELRTLLKRFFGQVDMHYQGFSDHYHSSVEIYRQNLHSQKRQLHPALQFGINRVYRPLKRFVPVRLSNAAIGKLLHDSYPVPEVDDITIAPERLRDTNVLIAVCRQPIRT